MDSHMDYFLNFFLCVFVSVNHLISFMENRSLDVFNNRIVHAKFKAPQLYPNLSTLVLH